MDKKSIIVISLVFAAIIVLCVPLMKIEKNNTARDKYEKKWGNIAKLAEDEPDARYITEHEEMYPEGLLKELKTNPELLDWVYEYPVHKDDYAEMSYTADELSGGSVPALYMRDSRWGYQKFEGGFIRTDGCAAVCLTMAYLYLTGKSDTDPYKIGKLAEELGYIGTFGGIRDDGIKPICEVLGLNINVTEYAPDRERVSYVTEEELRAVIDSGHVCMAGMAGETFGGHAIIIRAYDDEGYYINDPASPENTEKVWGFDTFYNEMMCLYDIYKN